MQNKRVYLRTYLLLQLYINKNNHSNIEIKYEAVFRQLKRNILRNKTNYAIKQSKCVFIQSKTWGNQMVTVNNKGLKKLSISTM